MKMKSLAFLRRKNNRKPARSGRSRILAGSIAALALSAVSLLAPTAAEAVTYQWIVDANGNTSLVTNWLGGVSPNGVGAIDDIIIFNNDITGAVGTPRVVTVDGALTMGTMTIGDLLGNSEFTLALGGGSITFDVTTGSALLFKNHGGGGIGALNAMDTISANATILDNLVINNALAGQGINITGQIDDAATGKSITKEGAGFVQLSSATSTFGGGITVNAGRLAISLSSAAAGPGAITLNTGAQFDILNDTALTFTNNFNIRGNSTINVDRAIGGGASNVTHVISGALTINNNTLLLTQGNGFNLNVTGQVNLAGAVSTISTAGPLVTFGSATGGKITGTGALNKVAGTLTLGNTSATANDYSGGTNMFGGILALNFSPNAATMGTGAVYIAPNTTLRINNAGNLTGPSQIAIQSTLGSVSNVSQSPTGAVTTTPGANLAGILEFGSDFAIGTAANGVKVSPILGAILRSNAATIASAVNMSNVGANTAGNGQFWLGTGVTATYSGTLSADTDGVLRLGTNNAAGTVLTIATTPLAAVNVTSVAIGHNVNNIIGTTTGLTGTVAYAEGIANTYTGVTTINRASTLQLLATTTQNPILSGNTTNVFGNLTTTATNYTGTAPMLTGTFNVMETQGGGGIGNYARGAFTIDNSLVALANTNLRLNTTSTINLAGGAFTINASNTAVISDQTIAGLTYQGGSILTVGKGTANTSGNLIITSAGFVRNNNGTLALTTNGANVIGAAATQRVTLSGGAPAVRFNNMTSADVVIYNNNATTDVRFADYPTANGFTPAVQTAAATAAAFNVASPTLMANVTVPIAVTAASWQAVRVDFAGAALNILTGGTLSINPTAASAALGGGLIFNNAVGNPINTTAITFGAVGAARIEAIVYVGGAGTVSNGGVFTANGLTKFGPGGLRLGNNAAGTNGDDGTGIGFTPGSTITINEGFLGGEFTIVAGANGSLGLRAVGTTLNNTNLRLAGGAWGDAAGGNLNANYLNAVTVIQDSSFATVAATQPRFAGLTFAARLGGVTDPVILHVNTGGVVLGSTIGSTLYNGVAVPSTISDINFTGPAAINTTAAAQTGVLGTNWTVLQGALKGAGTFDKWGTGTVLVTNPGGTMTGAITVQQGALVTTAGSGTPFGISAITVNPGAALRIANSTNIGGTLTVNSDITGLGALALGYNGVLPAITFNNATAGGPYAGVIGIDVSGFSTAIDQSVLGGGTSFLGSVGGANAGIGVTQVNAANYTGSITPGTSTAIGSGFTAAPAGSTYRLGGGGGVLNLNVLNQLSGANNVVLGAINNTNQGNSIAMVGGGGAVVLNQANSYSGFTTFNQGETVQIANDGAFGTSTLIFNGGTIQGDAYNRANGFTQGHNIGNAIKFAGDITINSNFSGPADLTFGGTVGLSNSAVGGSMRTINVNSATYAQGNGSIVTISGLISDGDSAYNGLNKAGAGTLRLTNSSNSYTGITQITAGNIVITNAGQLGTNPYVNMNGGNLSIWESDVTLTGKNLNFVASSFVDVAEGRTLTQDAATNWQGAGNLNKIGLGTLVLTGDNSFANLVIQGIVSASANNQLGNTATPGTITLNNAPGGGYGTGGISTLRFTDNIANLPRVISGTGAIDVLATKTVTSTLAAGAGTLNKVGAGTFQLTVTNGAATNWNANAGVLEVLNSATFSPGAAPLGTASTTTLNGGTIRITNTAGADYVTGNTGTMNINGGGIFALNDTTAFASQFTAASIARTNQGTLVIQPTANLAGSLGSQSARLLVTTNILGVAAASSVFNGIVSPVIVRLADSAPNSDADFVTYGAANGFASGTSTSFLGGLNPTQVASSAGIVLAGTSSVYALKTTGNISGAFTLQVVANGSTGNQVQLGGILMNGAGGTAPNISSDVFFGFVNNGVTQLNGLNYGEGVVYTSTGFTGGSVATLSGAVTANNFTKFGPGTLLINGTNRITGGLAVQSGSVQFGTNAAQPASINLILNDAGTLDLNGGTVKVAALTGTAGIVTNTNAAAGTVIFEGSNNTTFTGTIQNGTGTVRVIKGGSSTLSFNQNSANNPIANVNTMTGGFVMRSGNITLNTPYAFGPSGSTLELQGGSILLQPTGFGVGLATIIGSPGATSGGVNVLVNGTSTGFSTDNNGVFGTGFLDQYFQFNNLTLGNSTFSSNPAVDSQNLRFAGITSGGNAAIFNVLTGAGGAGRSVVELSGTIQNTGAVPFAINKIGTGTVRITGSANTYSGGTNVFTGGAVQVYGTTGTPMGSGLAVVNPGGSLRIAASSSTTGTAGVRILSSTGALGNLVLDGNFSPDNGTGAFTSTSMSSFLGGAVQIGIPTFAGTINMANIGDGNQFLGAYGASLGAAGVQFVGTLNAGAGARYRLGANATGLLTFAGADNTLTGANSVEIGTPIPTVSFNTTVPTNSTGTVVIQNSNNYSLGTLVNRGSTLSVQTGGSAVAGASTPLGSGSVEVRQGAVLRYEGAQGSAFNAFTGLNANTIILRNLATLNLNEANGLFSGQGGQGRWKDTTGVTLDGGTFSYTGASNLDVAETIGTVTAGLGNGTLNIVRSGLGTATLTVNDIVRGTQKGSVLVTTAAAGTLGQVVNYDRLLVTTPTFANSAAATTTIGTGAVGGISPVWMVDQTNNTYLSNQGSILGLQPLISGTPAAGQVAYTNVSSVAAFTAGLVGGTATVDMTTITQALGDNPAIFAARIGNFNLTTAAGTAVTGNTTAGSNVITTFASTAGFRVGQPVSGAGIPAGAVITAVGATTITITNQAGQTAAGVSVTPSFALNLASGGLILNTATTFTYTAPIVTSGELVIFRPISGNIAQLSGPITATSLTKFGLGDMGIGGDNRGTLTGDTTVSGDNWFRLENQYALGGSTTNPYANSNDLISNGGRFHTAAALSFLQTDIIINQDTRFGFNAGILGTMTVNGYSANTFGTPTVVASLAGNGILNVAGVTTLNGPASFFSGDAATSIQLHGGLAGAGSLQKWGAGNLSIGGNSAAYAQSVTVNQGALVSLNGIAAQTPFGTGAVTVNAGGIIGITNAGNVSGTFTINSDMANAGVLNMQYVGALPTVTFASTAANFDGVIALDVVGFSTALNQATIAGGKTFLGGGLANQLGAAYTAATLGAGSGTTYRIGGGGGAFDINSQVLSGANSVQFGIVSNTVQAQSINVTNGGGTVRINTPNAFTLGSTINNTGQIVEVGTATSLGGGTITFNGGTLRPNGNFGLPRLLQPLTLTNAIGFLGDGTIENNGADFILSGNVALTNDAYGTVQGAARTLTVAGATARSVLSGIVSDSGGGTASFSHLIKAGAGVLELRGANTYTGFTQINAGTLVIGNAGAIPSTSHIMLNAGALALWDSNYTLTNDVTNLSTSSAFFVGAGKTFTQSAASNIAGVAFSKTGNGVLVLGGNNSFAAMTVNLGRVEVSANANLGDTVTNGTVTFSSAAAGTADGGVLRITDSFATQRSITTSGTGTGGAIDVAAGKTLLLNGCSPRTPSLPSASARPARAPWFWAARTPGLPARPRPPPLTLTRAPW